MNLSTQGNNGPMSKVVNNINDNKKIAVIGDLNCDLVATGLATGPLLGQEILAKDFQMTLGGSATIFACGVARLGNTVTFISLIGMDEFGNFCLNGLRQAGISTDNIMRKEGTRTGATISLSTQEDRAFVTYLGAIAELSYEQLPISVLEGHSHLHMAAYFLHQKLRPSFPKIFSQAKHYGLTTSFDPNSDPAHQWQDDIQDVLKQVDILFVNEVEAVHLTRQQNVDVSLKRLGQIVPCVVVKLGKKGAIAIRDDEITFASGYEVNAIDTTGAGDSFAAGFVHAYLKGKTLQECLRMGNACGALSTLKVGGTLGQPDCQTLNQFLTSVSL